MAQYEADKIIRLIQFCCWKKKCEMNPAGFKLLQHEMDGKIKPGKPAPKGRYLLDLVSDANIAAKTGSVVGKNAEYINFLLEIAGFASWKSFMEQIYRIGELMHTELDLSAFSEAQTAVCFPAFLQETVLPEISAVRKTMTYSVNPVVSDATKAKQLFEFAGAQFSHYPFVICIIPFAWKDAVPADQWSELLSSKRILPVWLDEAGPWEADKVITGIKKQETLTGFAGVLLGIQHVEETLKKCHDPTPPRTPKANESHDGKRIQNLRDNTGAFFLGDIQIHGGNISMRDIHQTIKNKKS